MQTQQLRSIMIAGGNGTVTLIILLIAPLGLATVIVNTALVTLCSYYLSQVTDRMVGSGQLKGLDVELLEREKRSSRTDLDRRS